MANGTAHSSSLCIDQIPIALRSLPQWLVWKGKKKVPYQPNGDEAKTNDPSTWCSFEDAVSTFERGGYDGVGFVFSAECGFTGIDLDGCRNPDTGAWEEWAWDIIQQADGSYAEISPSGTGAKIFVRGKSPLPSGKNKRLCDARKVSFKAPGIEIYSKGKYFTVTGQMLEGSNNEVLDRQELIQRLADKYWPTPTFVAQHHEPHSGNGAVNDLDRCISYTDKIPGAVSGQGGHNATFHVACVAVKGFRLSDDDALSVLWRYNARCQPVWTEEELRHKVVGARAAPGPDGYLLNGNSSQMPNVNGSNGSMNAIPRREPFKFKLMTSKELAHGNFAIEWLIETIFVRGQPGGLFGGKKSLKTTLIVELLICLAAGLRFLGRFKVVRAVRVMVMSGESGISTLQETAKRIATSKGWSLEYLDNITWCFEVPSLANPEHVHALRTAIIENQIEVLFLDPAYLMMQLGESAGNLFIVGAMLRVLTEIGNATGCTIIICHHTKNRKIDQWAPPELEDIAWAGFQEWVRQWWLVSRRERYDPEHPGVHKLWWTSGGSAGHSSMWAIDVSEGTPQDEGGRHWKTELLTPSQARASAADGNAAEKSQRKSEKLAAEATRCQTRLLDLLKKFPDGATKTTIKERGPFTDIQARESIAALLESGTIETCDVEAGNGQKYAGFRITREERESHPGNGFPTDEPHTREHTPIRGVPDVCVCGVSRGSGKLPG